MSSFPIGLGPLHCEVRRHLESVLQSPPAFLSRGCPLSEQQSVPLWELLGRLTWSSPRTPSRCSLFGPQLASRNYSSCQRTCLCSDRDSFQTNISGRWTNYNRGTYLWSFSFATVQLAIRFSRSRLVAVHSKFSSHCTSLLRFFTVICSPLLSSHGRTPGAAGSVGVLTDSFPLHACLFQLAISQGWH